MHISSTQLNAMVYIFNILHLISTDTYTFSHKLIHILCKGWSKKNLTKLRLWLNLPYPLPPLGH